MSVFPLIKAPQIAVFTISILFAVINIPFVVLRFAARRRSWGRFTLSDAALLAAFVSDQSSQTFANMPSERALSFLSPDMHDGSMRHSYDWYVSQLGNTQGQCSYSNLMRRDLDRGGGLACL